MSTSQEDIHKISDQELQRRHEALNHYMDKFKEIFSSDMIPPEWKIWLDEMETELFERACNDKRDGH